jgi:hypothetical protein
LHGEANPLPETGATGMKRMIPPGPAPAQPATNAGPDLVPETKIRDWSTRRPNSMILQSISRQIWKQASTMAQLSAV